MSIHQHPVGQLLTWLACGGQLTADDLRELPLDDDVDRRAIESTIRSTAKKITAARRDGHNGRARELARETAAELIARTGDPLPERDDVEDELPDDATPRELAARIRRGGW